MTYRSSTPAATSPPRGGPPRGSPSRSATVATSSASTSDPDTHARRLSKRSSPASASLRTRSSTAPSICRRSPARCSNATPTAASSSSTTTAGHPNRSRTTNSCELPEVSQDPENSTQLAERYRPTSWTAQTDSRSGRWPRCGAGHLQRPPSSAEPRGDRRPSRSRSTKRREARSRQPASFSG